MKVQVLTLDEALLEKGRGKDLKPRKKRGGSGSRTETELLNLVRPYFKKILNIYEQEIERGSENNDAIVVATDAAEKMIRTKNKMSDKEWEHISNHIGGI